MFLQQVSHVSRFVSRFIGKATKLGQVSQAGVKVVAIKQYLESHITTQLHGHHHIITLHRSHNTFLVTSHQSVSVCVISPV